MTLRLHLALRRLVERMRRPGRAPDFVVYDGAAYRLGR